MTIEVRACPPDEWRVMRTLRLRALDEDPQAFTSLHEREAAFDEVTWRERTARTGIGWHDDAPAGLVGAMPVDDRVELVSMWVDPAHRSCGVGTALVAWAVGRAREVGVSEVHLGYADGNDAARTLYERCGFVATGEQHPLPSHPAGVEHRMRLVLT